MRFSLDVIGEGFLVSLYHGRTSLSMHFERRLVQLSGESQYITLNIERRPAAGKDTSFVGCGERRFVVYIKG
jgi:hypothetical protein